MRDRMAFEDFSAKLPGHRGSMTSELIAPDHSIELLAMLTSPIAGHASAVIGSILRSSHLPAPSNSSS
jgi:hypothetical protein